MPEFSRRVFLAATAGAALPAAAAVPKGILDATRSPYSADRSGKRDSAAGFKKPSTMRATAAWLCSSPPGAIASPRH